MWCKYRIAQCVCSYGSNLFRQAYYMFTSCGLWQIRYIPLSNFVPWQQKGISLHNNHPPNKTSSRWSGSSSDGFFPNDTLIHRLCSEICSLQRRRTAWKWPGFFFQSDWAKALGGPRRTTKEQWKVEPLHYMSWYVGGVKIYIETIEIRMI